MLFQEIRQATRLLAKNPGFTAIAALSLALGIGANSAIFSLTDAILLRPLSIDQPSKVLSLSTDTPSAPFDGISYPDFRDIRDKNQSLAGVVAYQFSTVGYADSPKAQPQMRMGLMVSDNFFSVLGIPVGIGRAFLADEGKAGRDAVVVLSYESWVNQFGRDRSAIGRTIRMNGVDFTIIGVAPKSFTGIDQYVRPAFFFPLSMGPRLSAAAQPNFLEDRSNRSLSAKARLKPGVSRESAQAELTAIGKNLEKAYPDTNRNRSIVLRTELQARFESDQYDAALVMMLMGLVGLVLIIACANVANLLLARARSRSREIAIRLAIGAGRLRLLRQLLIESLMLALCGCLLGLGVAFAGIRFLQTIKIPGDIPVVIDTQLDSRVLVFSLLAALASTLLFGIAPAWQALKTELVPALRSAGLTASARRRTIGRNALVVGQVALSLVLLVAAGMLLDGFRKALSLNPGFRTDHLMIMEFDTSFVRSTPEQSSQFYRHLVDRARALPGVRSATLSATVPFSNNQSGETLIPEGYQFPKGQESVGMMAGTVDERYFSVLHAPLVRGRAFTINDKADSPHVAIVNEAFAAKYWPGQDAIGKRIRLNDSKGPVFEVVGLAKTGRYGFIAEPPTPYAYFPFAQNPKNRMSIFVETYGDPAAIAAPLREVVRSLSPDQPIYNAHTFEDYYVQRAIKIVLLILQLVVGMGVLGLTLALVGLYGLIAYSVSRRTQEIGIRMALGAQRSDVVKLVLRQGFVLSIIGIAIGFVASLGVRGVLAQGFAGLGSLNPAVLGIVPVALLLVTMAACYLPARRASKVEPVRALRYE